MNKYFLTKSYIKKIGYIYFSGVVTFIILAIILVLLVIIYHNYKTWTLLFGFGPVFVYGIFQNYKYLLQWRKFANTDFVCVDFNSACLLRCEFGEETQYPAKSFLEIKTQIYKNELDCISISLSSIQKVKLRGFEKPQRLLFDIKELRKLNREQ